MTSLQGGPELNPASVLATVKHRPGAGTATPEAGNARVPHQVREHRCVPGLSWTDQSDQRPAVPVDEGVPFRAPASTERLIVWSSGSVSGSV